MKIPTDYDYESDDIFDSSVDMSTKKPGKVRDHQRIRRCYSEVRLSQNTSVTKNLRRITIHLTSYSIWHYIGKMLIDPELFRWWNTFSMSLNECRMRVGWVKSGCAFLSEYEMLNVREIYILSLSRWVFFKNWKIHCVGYVLWFYL